MGLRQNSDIIDNILTDSIIKNIIELNKCRRQ